MINSHTDTTDLYSGIVNNLTFADFPPFSLRCQRTPWPSGWKGAATRTILISASTSGIRFFPNSATASPRLAESRQVSNTVTSCEQLVPKNICMVGISKERYQQIKDLIGDLHHDDPCKTTNILVMSLGPVRLTLLQQYVWATSSKHLRCSVVLQRAIDALTNVWWQGVKSITQQNCRATSCEAGNSYPGKAVLWVIMMVTFSDIVTCHIFGNSCDLWYTHFDDLLYIMHPWNTGPWEDQSLQIHLVVFWDAQKIVKKHLPTLLQQAGNLPPPKKTMACYLKLPT